MPRHDDPLLSFDVPRDWEDRSVVAYTAPIVGNRQQVANLVMTRDRLSDGEDLAAYSDRQLALLAEQLDGFVLHKSDAAEVAGRPAQVMAFSSLGDDGVLDQRLTMIALPGGQVASLTMTAPRDEAAQLAPLFERIVSSVRATEST